MALTETQREDIAAILGITAFGIEDQIAYLGARLTAVKESKIADEITRWETYGDDYEHIHPLAENFGYEESAASRKNDIKKNIATILERLDWASASGSNSFKVTL